MQAPLDATAEFINTYFAAQWKKQNLTPAQRCSDEEFIRRASLDIVGRVAAPDEVRTFVADAGPNKRARLVDKLVGSKDYAHNWAGIWTNWLLGRSGPGLLYRQQLYVRLNDVFAAPKISYKDMVTELIAAAGKSNDKPSVNFVLAHLGMEIPEKDQTAQGMFDMVPLTSRTLRLFLGYRLVAYQLPDHPVHPDFKPEQFWGVNAFFRQVERVGGNPQKDPNPKAVLDLKDNPNLNKSGMVSFQDKDGKTHSTGAVFLDGRKLPADGKQTRREVVAGFVTSHENFARAYANRLWGHFFGRGLHERAPVDDFGSHQKLVHAELLDRLAKDFVAGGYDPNKLIRAICASDAYQLRSVSNPSNLKEDTEIYFSRMPLKIMLPEQVLESLLTTLPADAESRKLRASSYEHIGRRVGDAEWDDLPAQERIIQNVVLINRKEINDAVLSPKTGPLARALAQKGTEKILEELYLTALNRRPTEKETAQIKGLIDKEKEKDLANLWQDLYWALLNSSEFILNH